VQSVTGFDVAAPRTSCEKFTFVKADVLSTDFRQALAGTDVLVHLAFIVTPPRNMTMETIDRINVEGSRRVFQAAADAGVPRIVYTSSVAAYGMHADNPVGIPEDHPLRPNPDWYYSRTKGEVERLLDALQAKHPALKILRVRPSIFVGPDINNPVSHIVRDPFLLCGNPEWKIDFCWDRDVVDGVLRTLRHPASDVFNLAADGPLSVPEIGRLLGKPVLRVPPRLLAPLARVLRASRLLSQGMAEWLAVLARGHILVSNQKARARLGWAPRFTAAEALLEFERCLKRA